MLTLFHQLLCPHSRYVRLILGEYGIAARLVEERFWERREEFLLLNPAGSTPVLVEEGRKRGAEFIAHGLSRRHIIHIGMSEDEERDCIRASIEAVEKATGTRPIGWSGPDFQETPNTPNLLAAEGIRYVCDWGNDEQPYGMTPRTGELYSLGVNALSRRQLHPPARSAHDQRSQPVVARVV